MDIIMTVSCFVGATKRNTSIAHFSRKYDCWQMTFEREQALNSLISVHYWEMKRSSKRSLWLACCIVLVWYWNHIRPLRVVRWIEMLARRSSMASNLFPILFINSMPSWFQRNSPTAFGDLIVLLPRIGYHRNRKMVKYFRSLCLLSDSTI